MRATYKENKAERKRMDKEISSKRKLIKMINDKKRKKGEKIAKEWNKGKKEKRMIFLNHKRKLIELDFITKEEIEAEEELGQI